MVFNVKQVESETISLRYAINNRVSWSDDTSSREFNEYMQQQKKNNRHVSP